MKKLLTFVTLPTIMLLGACNKAPSAVNVNGATPVTTASNTVPAGVSQLVAVRSQYFLGKQDNMSDAKLKANVKQVNSVPVYDLKGQLVTRIEITGPKKIDIFTVDPRSLTDAYIFHSVGATDELDPLYAFGAAKPFVEKLQKSVKAAGSIKKLVTTDFMSVIVESNSGKLFEHGKTKPLSKKEARALKVSYGNFLVKLSDIRKNKADVIANQQERWKKTLAPVNGDTEDIKNLQVAAKKALADYLNSDGELNAAAAMNALISGKESTIAGLSATPAKFSAQGSGGVSDGTYKYNGDFLPGGGSSQRAYMWTDNKLADYIVTWVAKPFFPWGQHEDVEVNGCISSTIQAMMFDLWRQHGGTNHRFQFKHKNTLVSPEPLDLPLYTRIMSNNGIKIAKSKFTNGNFAYGDRLHVGHTRILRKDKDGAIGDETYKLYEIMNEKDSWGRNKSTVEANLGHMGKDAVAGNVWEVKPGINNTAKRIFPNANLEGWGEWKTAGFGSNGTMRKILARQLPEGRAVAAGFMNDNNKGHVDIVGEGKLTSFFFAHDAYVRTTDNWDSFKTVTGVITTFATTVDTIKGYY